MLDLFHGMSSDNSELDLISAPHRATLGEVVRVDLNSILLKLKQ